ncbi:hypothetical protein EJ03DRAFT_106389 [Teratosphaeria nubilosa]|uniref:Uncharacterized protein n=1 Tax=Teratosphaeria nubilosa TaxID=161662 RepID=A0A6G1L8B6_9PEZI|nr:hypothetical protein EJ03DRAFT_106389 [Teratosphaeria nubilosa]
MDILSQPVSPLQAGNSGKLYGWLLEGTPEHTRRIRGHTGLCPKLLHIFAQIIQIAALMAKDPQSDTPVLRQAAEMIGQRLEQLHQSTEMSEGHQDTQDLFASCESDASGKVSTVVKVTELTGEAWRATAKLYFHCRLLKKPRWHNHVLAAMATLRTCVERMPYTGPLFSSQAPFFPVFILAILSFLPEDRFVATEWFDTVVSGASCRSVSRSSISSLVW